MQAILYYIFTNLNTWIRHPIVPTLNRIKYVLSIVTTMPKFDSIKAFYFGK